MTPATRHALYEVGRILHEAGWDEPTSAPPVLTEEALLAMHHTYDNLLREDHRAIIEETLGKGRRIEEAGRALGIGTDESKSLFFEALTRLSDFIEAAEGQGFVPGYAQQVRTGAGN